MKYRMVIEWSEEDSAYVVFLPEWVGRVYQPVTDGATYEEAAHKGASVLETLVRVANEDGQPLPQHITTAVA